MQIASDYIDLLRILNKHKVKYLIVGAYAVIYYTEPRYTKDLDIWVQPDSENAERVYRALKEFGAPLKDIEPSSFTDKSLVYQMGVAPVRVDILMGLPMIEFDQAWKHKKITTFDDIKVNIIGIDELIYSKKTAKRPTDLVDIESLQLGLKQRKKK